MGSRIQTWRPKTFRINRTTGAGPINTFISSISSTLSLFIIRQLVKGSSSVTSPQICCGLLSWQRNHLWTKEKASPRFCWVRDPTGGTVEECLFDFVKVCSSAWMFAIETSRSSGLISYELPITPPQIQQSWCLFLIRPKSLNFTVYRAECFSGLEGPLWFATRGGS